MFECSAVPFFFAVTRAGPYGRPSLLALRSSVLVFPRRFRQNLSELRRRDMIELTSSNLPPLRMPWKNCIAVGRAYELLRRDLLEHLAKVQREIGFRYCRFHGIFHDDMEVV